MEADLRSCAPFQRPRHENLPAVYLRPWDDGILPCSQYLRCALLFHGGPIDPIFGEKSFVEHWDWQAEAGPHMT